MYTASTEARVRYGETDRMGYLYYGNYALYYEIGRVEMIRALGLSYRQMEDEGIIMPVAELRSKFIRPAFYDDLITIKTTIREWPQNHKIIFHSELYNEKAELLNIGAATLVFLDATTREKIGMPRVLHEKLKPYFEK